MGNTITSCTSGNREDQIPKKNAPLDRPVEKAEENNNDGISKDEATPIPEGSSFIKNINIRKSLRAARKSVVKPFKKTKKQDALTTEEGILSDDNDQKTKEVELPVVTVETHVEEPKENAPLATSEVDTSSIQLIVEEVSSHDEKDQDPGSKDEILQDPEKDQGSGETVEEAKSEDIKVEEEEANQVAEIEIEGDIVSAIEIDANVKESLVQDNTDGEESKSVEKARVTEALFNKYDKDGSGKLKRSEIKRLLKDELGLDREEASVMQLLIDEDGSHEVCLEEFKVTFLVKISTVMTMTKKTNRTHMFRRNF